jgi:FkbM family methyltransferase
MAERDIETIDTTYGRISVDMATDKKIGERLARGEYHQQETLDLLKNFITPDSVVIDIGAHIGTLSVPLAHMAGKVIAFEPGPATFSLLKKNIEQNNLTVDVRNKGLGAKSGHATVQTMHPTNAGANMLALGDGPIEISTLDDEIDYGDLIKMDVEGMEPSVLEGATDLIEKHHPIILSEINLSALRANHFSPRDIENFLTKRGYDLFLPIDDGGGIKLGKIGSLGAIAASIAPRASVLRSPSAPFDILAIPRGKTLPLSTLSYSQTVSQLIQQNVKQKGKRIAKIFAGAPQGSVSIRKAVTLRASSIGDSLMAKYFLENIHAQYPDAQCSILVSGKAGMIRDLLAAYPWIEIFEANKSEPMSIVQAWRKLSPSDATVTQYSGRGQFATASKIFARSITRIGKLAGFTDAWPLNKYLYDYLIPFSMRRAMRLYERDALEALGVEPTVDQITLVPKHDTGVVERIGLTKQKYVVLNLFSGTTKRGLSLPFQIEITKGIIDALPSGAKVILTGGAFDQSVILKIKEAVPQVEVAPGLTMQDLIVLVQNSGGVVSLDTGVGHIAAQVGVPLAILRTCWGYQWWVKEQYAREGITVLTREDLCDNGHVNKDFPDCLNKIPVSDIVRAAQNFF